MTAILQRAFAEAAKLPEREQDLIALWLLAEVAAAQTQEPEPLD